MSVRHVKSPVNEQALRDASITLAKIEKDFFAEFAHIRESMIRSIEAYNAFLKQRDELMSRRTALIREVSAFDPEAAIQLEAGTRHYEDPEGSTSVELPKSPRSSQRRTARAASSGPHPQPRTPSPRRLRRKQPPAPPSTSVVAAKNATAPPPATTRLTVLPPIQTIKTDHVTKEHYWVFDFAAGRDRTALYILRCPSSTCDNPIFSKHPLRQGRAERHFESCGVKFRNTADLVRRYAHVDFELASLLTGSRWVVVPGRKGREVKRTWAKAHNLRLLAGDEVHLACENLE
ncbi:hypothetical protein PG994_004910 [Apiospora phragmitis]|uniref:Uncharacterized protein n=1 Tax=Apiospora phragmitis TaxID=2905665 RepID=A0ABR1VRX1_9PEZI